MLASASLSVTRRDPFARAKYVAYHAALTTGQSPQALRDRDGMIFEEARFRPGGDRFVEMELGDEMKPVGGGCDRRDGTAAKPGNHLYERRRARRRDRPTRIPVVDSVTDFSRDPQNRSALGPAPGRSRVRAFGPQVVFPLDLMRFFVVYLLFLNPRVNQGCVPRDQCTVVVSAECSSNKEE